MRTWTWTWTAVTQPAHVTYVQIHCLKLVVLLKGVLSQLRHLEHEGQTFLQRAARGRDSRMSDRGEGEAVPTPSFFSSSRAAQPYDTTQWGLLLGPYSLLERVRSR